MAAAAHSLRVTLVQRYTESYFRFRLERPQGFRFTSGQFIMVGLETADGKVMRAYSMASPHWDDALEFFSIVVPDGKLTSELQHIEVGSEVLMSAKAVGSLTLKSLGRGGRRLFMLSTGTGVAPFASVIRDEETYEQFDEVYLTQTCRFAADLQYGYDRVADAKECPLVGEEATKKLRFYGSVTREDYKHRGRITHLIESGQLFTDLDIPPFDPETDRVMICGSKSMLMDTRAVLDARGFSAGSGTSPAGYVWEKAFTG